MLRASCTAVLDIRSSELTAVVGERGVNKTFIIKSKYTSKYEGYAEGELLDKESFVSAMRDVVKSTLSSTNGIKCFYVGIPAEFLKLVNTDKVLNFSSSRKITQNDVRNLSDMAAISGDGEWRTIRHSCLYYVISDKRKLIDPVGAVSDCLHGKFSFFLCKNSFINTLMGVFSEFGDVASVKLIPIDFAEAMYLVEPEKRDECAVLVDLGFMSSTYSVICGNGLLYSEPFSIGIGHVAYCLMSEMNIPYEVALSYLSTVNLNAKDNAEATEECMFDGVRYEFPSADIRRAIRKGLDGICATIDECRRAYSGRNIDGKPLLITGEGVKTVRGTAEHFIDRLSCRVEVIAPKVPYYDKPHFSSLLSLMDTAFGDNK